MNMNQVIAENLDFIIKNVLQNDNEYVADVMNIESHNISNFKTLKDEELKEKIFTEIKERIEDFIQAKGLIIESFNPKKETIDQLIYWINDLKIETLEPLKKIKYFETFEIVTYANIHFLKSYIKVNPNLFDNYDVLTVDFKGNCLIQKSENEFEIKNLKEINALEFLRFKLRKFRNVNDWDQERTATNLGVSRRFYQNIETGEREIDQVYKLAIKQLIFNRCSY